MAESLLGSRVLHSQGLAGRGHSGHCDNIGQAFLWRLLVDTTEDQGLCQAVRIHTRERDRDILCPLDLLPSLAPFSSLCGTLTQAETLVLASLPIP